MAALSVESGRDGKYTGRPAPAASRSNVERNSLLAATPPGDEERGGVEFAGGMQGLAD